MFIRQLGLQPMAFTLEAITTTDISLHFFLKNKHLTSQRVSKNLAHTLRLSEGSLKVAQCGLFSHLVSHHDHQSYCADWMASLCAQKDLLSAQQKRRDYYAEASRTFWTQEPARSAQGCQAYMISW